MSDGYEDIGVFFGTITYLLAWLYFGFAWGPLMGFFFGWIPAMFISLIVVVAWPLIVIAIIIGIPMAML
jgi:hypothetical protein